jgi:hypothetical protein
LDTLSKKNYNLPDAKAVFTGNTGSTKEMITLALVPTAAEKKAHLLLQSKEKRKEFDPQCYIWTLAHITKRFGKTSETYLSDQTWSVPPPPLHHGHA